MKVLMNTLNFSAAQIPNKKKSDLSCFVTECNTLDTVSFKGITSDKEMLKRMLEDADNGIIRRVRGIRNDDPQGFIANVIDKISRIFGNENRSSVDSLIQKYYNRAGILNFVKSNLDFFNRIIAYGEENSINSREFRALIDSLKNKKLNPIPALMAEIDKLTDRSKRLFVNIGQENGKIQFLSAEDARNFLREVYITMASGKGKKPVAKETLSEPVMVKPAKSVAEKTAPAVKQVETFDAEALLKEYHERRLRQKDPYTLKTEEEKRLWMEEDEELRKMLHKLNEKNISLVIKEEFNPDPMIDRDKKKNYFYSWKVGHAMMNEASKMDYLEMFEKYGERYYDPSSPMNSSIANLGIASNEPTSDKILNKYIDVINKIAIKDPEGLNDAVWVAGTLNYTAEKMSEETILKFIDVLNRISYEQQEFFTTKYAIDRTIYKDSPRVKAALEDFEKTVQDLPYLFE